jgi:hypothetical protein
MKAIDSTAPVVIAMPSSFIWPEAVKQPQPLYDSRKIDKSLARVDRIDLLIGTVFLWREYRKNAVLCQ